MIVSSERGMTLVEIMVALAIVATVSIAITSFEKNIFGFKTAISDSLITAQDARTIIRTIVTELRSATPSNNGSYPITNAGTSTITFFSDYDGDGVVDQIRYFASSTKLYRGVITPTGSPLTYGTSSEKISVLAANLRNTATTSVFSYFDGSYNGTSSTTELAQPVSVTSVRLVKVTLMLDVDQNNAPISRTYTTEVTLRNLKDNL
jgi:prepilin-type N-terminal cleavage/methylation domain-containing protein